MKKCPTEEYSKAKIAVCEYCTNEYYYQWCVITVNESLKSEIITLYTFRVIHVDLSYLTKKTR